MTDSLFSILRSLIFYSIDAGIPLNALWFAERLFAFFPKSEESRHLVALSYTHLNKWNVAIEVIGKSTYGPSLQLRARCYQELRRFAEAEKAMSLYAEACRGMIFPLSNSASHRLDNLPNAGSVDCLQGLLAKSAGRLDVAKEHFREALSKGPFLWTAFEGLCHLGDDVDADIFQEDSAVAFLDSIGALPAADEHPVLPTSKKAKSPAKTKPKESAVPKHTAPITRTTRSTNVAASRAPVTSRIGQDRKVAHPRAKLEAATSNSGATSRNLRVSQDSVGGPSAASSRAGSATIAARGKAIAGLTPVVGTKRKQAQSIIESATLVNTSGTLSGRVNDENAQPGVFSESPRDISLRALRYLLDLIRKCGRAVSHLGQFRLKEAIREFEGLVDVQRRSGWVLCQLGRCFSEKCDYDAAEAKLRLARELEPWRLEGMDTYSVVLWQLEKEVDLSCLSHELVEFDRTSPVAWFAVGNTFSMKYDHDMAIRSFQRAIQLDPLFVWAYTLAGHACLDNEDHDRAEAYFRQAVVLDPRHHNAWYGLASKSFRQDMFENAKYFYEKAFSINSSNFLLAMLVGMSLQRLERFRDAHMWYQRAQSLEPEHPVVRFRIADILYRLGYYDEALPILHALKDTHSEHSVWVLLGRVYRALGDRQSAAAALTNAEDHKDWRVGKRVRGELEELYGGDENDEDGTRRRLSMRMTPGSELLHAVDFDT
ncbi:anaphase-promoting complex subunit cdc27 [Gonapodya sp. JEL0774]|nr:anaphase-promoting complex subunit cdc27 [Gonapodya sp. JEL0774]